MTRRRPFDRRIVGGVALGALAGAALFGRQALPWSAAIAGLAAAWALWRTWDARRYGQRVLDGLRARWAELPGARWTGEGLEVHDGTQPLTIRISRRRRTLRAALSTPFGDTPVAFRVWPVGERPPSLDPAGAPVGGPPVERAPQLEARLGGHLRVEASEEARVDMLLDADVTAALLVVAREAAGTFAGLGYDGQRLTVHLQGPVVADPERSTRLARALWQPFVP